MGNIDFYNRCEYDVFMCNSAVPEHGIFIMKNYGGGDNVVDACIESIESSLARHGICDYMEERECDGDFLPSEVRFMGDNDETILRFCGFKADPKTYTAIELINNPKLLPLENVDRFKRRYNL